MRSPKKMVVHVLHMDWIGVRAGTGDCRYVSYMLMFFFTLLFDISNQQCVEREILFLFSSCNNTVGLGILLYSKPSLDSFSLNHSETKIANEIFISGIGFAIDFSSKMSTKNENVLDDWESIDDTEVS